ncbi:GNAT family N-acetyltransferase [Nocardioides sp.]|uniref:GNAT family N-acetyltransferase n=1 Tax=Nocardioides sp. TaxID=35761 RepID=UPI002B264F2E|nr:GNAT family N-acetyltransferase [Nocardioides sp.]
MTQAHEGEQSGPPATEAAETVAVVDVPERSRFEISVNGAPAGFADYSDSEGGAGAQAGVRAFPHTVVHPEFGGRGMSKILIRAALDAARVADLEVLPLCSAVQHFIASNAEYVDLVPEARRAEFDL